MALKVLRGVEETASFAESVRREGRRLALVPTMGFLHAGHLSLMGEARSHAEVVVTSIFVNPTQFGPKEDFGRYPRDFEGDLKKCGDAGVDVVFTPEVENFYPRGYQTYVETTELQRGLCGDRRPGHFRGVATIVTKFFALLRPHVALFGEKDYQQLQVIKALSRDLNLGVQVIGMPTVREADGLAMSSRNSYLSAEQRQQALALSRGLRSAQKLAEAGVLEAATLVQAVRKELGDAAIREDYVELVDAQTLRSLEQLRMGEPARLLVAAFVGPTRLIDNVAVVLAEQGSSA